MASLAWSVGSSSSDASAPTEFFPAAVPGAVQLDWAAAHGWPEWWKADHPTQYRWMEDAFWTYRAELPGGGFWRAWVDYACLVKVDGEIVARHEGMWSPVEVDLTGTRKGSVLEVVVLPAPSLPKDGTERTLNTATTKPGVFYGWDFAPRLVPMGIWDGGEWLPSRPADWSVQASLEGAVGRLRLWTEARDAKWSVLGPDGAVVAETAASEADLAIPSPALWWPNGQGEQPLYTVTLAAGGESRSRRVGFRTVRLVPYEGLWNEHRGLPGTRFEPPITLEVNGRPIFGLGSNWVPPSMFPGADGVDTYRPLLEQCRDARFNLLRVWGGGGIPKDAFFDLCDEMGILVWQEFPLACARYSEEPAYLEVLERDAVSIVERLRNHPSLALWCGGNELFCPWSRMTDQDPALRLLNSVCFRHDPERPFLPTSPLDGMGHGGYTFLVGEDKECLAAFQESSRTAYTEFGCGGPASLDKIKTFIPNDELRRVQAGTLWETHHAFRAWDGHQDSWLMLPMLESIFGKFATLDDLLEAGQLLQAEGMRHLYEEARRQKPRCSMALSWCLNEPWPTAANNALVSWPAEAKPALAAVAEACRPIMASVRIPKLRWSPGERMRIEPFLLNDTPNALPGTWIQAYFATDTTVRFLGEACIPPAAPNRHAQGDPFTVPLPAELPDTFGLVIRSPQNEEWDNVYTLIRVR